MDSNTPWHRKDYIHIVVLSLVIFLIYLNSTSGEFVFDDWVLIEGNEQIHNLANWKQILSGYRPIRTLFLAFLYHLFTVNPPGYHVANIAIHALTAAMVYHLCRLLTRRSNVAFFSALIFAVHPIQTDAVSYISGIRDTLSALFYVTSFYFFVKYRQEHRYFILGLCLVFNVLGIFTKEVAASLVLMYLMYDFVQVHPVSKHQSLRQIFRSALATLQVILKRHSLFYGGLTIFFVGVVWRYVISQRSSAHISLGGIDWYGGSWLLTYISIPKIIVYYIKQLIFPIHLLVDYKYFPIIAQKVYEPQVIFALMIVAGILIAAFKLLASHRLMAFSILWFLIALSPGLNILPHHEFMAEHYLYLPSVGFALLLGLVFASALEKSASRRNTLILLSVFWLLVGLYGIRTVVRNQDWQNDLTLSEAQLKVRPQSARTLAEMGYLYSKMNLLESSERVLKDALEIAPHHSGARNNLGVVYSRLGDQERAIKEFEAALRGKRNPSVHTFANLGIAYMILDDEENGIRSFQKAVQEGPIDRLALISLTYIYLDKKQHEKAVEYIRRNLKYRPKDVEAYYLLAKIYEEVFQFEAATKIYQIIMDIDPDDQKAKQLEERARSADKTWKEIEKQRSQGKLSVEGYMQLADLYRSIDELERAIAVVEEGLGIYKNHPDLLKKYNDVLFYLGLYDEAEGFVRMTLTVLPGDSDSHLLMAKLYALKLQFEQAGAELQAIRTLNQDDPSIEQAAKTIAENGKRYKRVEQLQASGSNPDEERFLLGKIYQSLGLIEKAMESYSEIGDQSAFSIRAKHELVNIYLGGKGVRWRTKAIKRLEEIINRDPANAEAYNRLGFVYLAHVKDYERARRYFAKSLELHPDQPEARRLKRLLKSIDQYLHAVLVERKYMLPYIDKFGEVSAAL